MVRRSVFAKRVANSDGNLVYAYYNRIGYCDMVIEELQRMCMFLSVRIRSAIRKMATLSTLLLSIYVIRIRIRLLYGNGNGNENRSFFHDGNEQFPSLIKRLECLPKQWQIFLRWKEITWDSTLTSLYLVKTMKSRQKSDPKRSFPPGKYLALLR